MPSFIRKSPVEFRNTEKANKKVVKLMKESNKSTGIMGTPKADADGFKKVVDMLETVETNLETYVQSVVTEINNAMSNIFTRVIATFDFKNKLVALNKLIQSSKFSLDKIPLDEVQTIKNYIDSYTGYLQYLQQLVGDPYATDIRDEIQQVIQYIDKIIQSLQLKVMVYDSGVVQPVIMQGGCMACQYNLDEPLSKSDMYQTKKYLFPQYNQL